MLCEMVHFSKEEKSRALTLVKKVEDALLNNCKTLSCHPNGPVLIVGDMYPGIWLEHNQDNLFITQIAPDVAWNSQEIFINNQNSEGLIPYVAKFDQIEKFKDVFPNSLAN